jgi:hypothetical protein
LARLQRFNNFAKKLASAGCTAKALVDEVLAKCQ